MQKLLGCVLIFFASAGTGFLYAADFQRSLDQMIYLQQIIYMLKGEMEYTQAPLCEMFGRVAVRVKEPYRSWLGRLELETENRCEKLFSDIWDQCMREELSELRLKGEYENLVRELGTSLGQMDAKTGVGTFTLYLNRMTLEIQKARESLSSRKRLSSCLGIMGGLFLVIILI